METRAVGPCVCHVFYLFLFLSVVNGWRRTCTVYLLRVLDVFLLFTFLHIHALVAEQYNNSYLLTLTHLMTDTIIFFIDFERQPLIT